MRKWVESRMKNVELYLGYAVFFTVGLAINIVFALLPDIREAFQLSYAEAGSIMVVLQVGFITSLALRTFLLRKLGMRKLLLLASVIWLSGVGCITLSTAKYFLYAGVSLSGFAYGTFQNLFAAYVVIASDCHKGKRISLMNAFFGIGSVAAPVVGSLALAFGNWRIGYLPILLLIGGVIMVLFNIRFMPVFEETKGDQGPFPFGFTFILVGLFVLIYPMTEFTAGSWTSEYWSVLGDTKRMPYSVVTAFFWVSFTLGRLVTGKIADRIGAMTFMFYTTGLFMGVSTLWVLMDHPWVILLCLVGIGFTLAGMFPIFLMQAGEFFPRHIGTITSWFFFFLSIGGMVSQKLVGEMAEVFGIHILPMVFLGSSVLLMTVLLLLHREGKQRHVL